MKLSNKQKQAVEKITGRYWHTFPEEALRAYFSYTDKGIKIECDDPDFNFLMESHHQHSIIVELWKKDFKNGLLFLWDFLDPKYPIGYIKHAFEIYQSINDGYIPRCYREHPLWANR